jgi:hypothetical protein
MNYLIHFLLAGGDDELRLGNLLGDYVKGRVERFEQPGVTDRRRTSIQVHRTIVTFSDRHPAVHRSKKILSAEYGRLSARRAAYWPTTSIAYLPTSTSSCPSCARAARSSWLNATLVERPPPSSAGHAAPRVHEISVSARVSQLAPSLLTKMSREGGIPLVKCREEEIDLSRAWRHRPLGRSRRSREAGDRRAAGKT